VDTLCAAILSTACALGACVRVDRRGVTVRPCCECLPSGSGSCVFCMTVHHQSCVRDRSVLASLGSWVAVRGRLGGRVILHEARSAVI
jgi:hypothetical protein